MPNWVANKCLVIGKDKKKLTELFETEFQFSKILPLPVDLDPKKISAPNKDEKLAKAMRLKHGSADWYEWCNKNWGTKWDRTEYEVIEDIGEETFEIYFMTAWSPPTEILKHISKKYDVKIIDHFEEEGYNSAGHLEFIDGEMSYGGSRW